MAGETMQALVRDSYGSTDVLHIEELPRPTPGPDEVVVRVEAASVNTADHDHLLGRPVAGRVGTGVRSPRNRVLGLDVAGVVEHVGSSVTEFSPGDEVWADLFAGGFGAFAEYVGAPSRAFAPKPDGVSFEDAATVPHSGLLAFQGLKAKGGVRRGDSVLINGAGGCVGPFAIQLAKTWGAEVTAVDHTKKLDLMRSAGADHVVDYTQQDITRSSGRYDMILDIAANRSFFAYRRILAPGGRYVLIARNLTGFAAAGILGGLVSAVTSRRMGVFGWAPSKRADLASLGSLLQRGEVRPIIDGICSLAEIPEALERMRAGDAHGKIVVKP